MKHQIAVKKQVCLQHTTVIKQRTRQGYNPGDQDGIFYSLWCKVCDHHLTVISHDEAWSAKKDGFPFEDLNYKITNSTYKSMVEGSSQELIWAAERERTRAMNQENGHYDGSGSYGGHYTGHYNGS
jgi:hypothetical protein|tara:strand:+ start:1324 stop:1701 length:378 start_codon:yes stop_codon:yes gene_type:complete